jgi:hypothetical protein
MSATKFLAPTIGAIAIAAGGTAAYMHFKKTPTNVMPPLATDPQADQNLTNADNLQQLCQFSGFL